MAKFIKDHFVLGVGIVVPILMMAFFFVSAQMQTPSSARLADMLYDIILSDLGSLGEMPIGASLFVRDNTLYTQYAHGEPNLVSIPKLYIYEASTKKLRHLDFPPPNASDESIFGHNLPVEATKLLKLDANEISPDGFEFTYERKGHEYGGIINNLLVGGGSDYYGPYLKKGDVFFHLLPGDGLNQGYVQLRFVGWVISKQDGEK